jgi:hypothetical protein
VSDMVPNPRSASKRKSTVCGINGPPSLSRKLARHLPFISSTNKKLPQPIANYFEAANAHQTDAVVAAFAKDALVTDEHQENRGGTAIKEWSNQVNEKYQPHARGDRCR